MKRLAGFLTAFVLLLSLTAINSFAEQKGAAGAKYDRLSGRVQMINKETSQIDVFSGNFHRKVLWSPQTKFTYRNKPASLASVREGGRVICLGKFDDKGRLIAARVDVRE